MEIRVGNILYIYKFVGGGHGASRGGFAAGLAAENRKKEEAAKAALRRIMGIQPRDAKEAASLEKLEQIIASIMGKIHKVPGDKMKGIILDAVMKIASKAGEGDIAGALELASQVEEMTNKAVKAGERIANAMGRLNMLAGSLPESGKKAVGDLIKKAQKMIDAASEPSELEAIASSLEFAVDVVNTMAGYEAGSPGYQGCMRTLAGIMSDIESAVNPAGGAGLFGGAPGMAQDALGLSFKDANDALAQLKGKTKDAVKQAQIGKLEERLAGLRDLARELPEGMKPFVQQGINQFLTDIANGDVQQGAERLNDLFGKVDQLVKLNKVVDTKLKLGRQVADRLNGPAKAALEAVLDKAGAARQCAETPERLVAIEEMILLAVMHAERPCHGKAAQNAQLRQLKAIEKSCEAMLPGAEGGDTLTLSQGEQGEKKAQKPQKTEGLKPPVKNGQGDSWVGNATVAVGVVVVTPMDEADLDRIASMVDPNHVPTVGEEAAAAQKPEKQEKRARLGGKPDGKHGQVGHQGRTLGTERLGSQPRQGTGRLSDGPQRGTGRLSGDGAQAGRPASAAAVQPRVGEPGRAELRHTQRLSRPEDEARKVAAGVQRVGGKREE